MSATPIERPDKAKIPNLPPHAQFQWLRKTWYVYFPYSYRTPGGKLKQERDYIGKLSPDGTAFIPNRTYRLSGCPAWENRPPENWKNPQKRAEALSKSAHCAAPAAKPGAQARTPDPALDLPMPGGETDFSPEGQARTFENLKLDSGKILQLAKARAQRFPRGDLLAFDALIPPEPSENDIRPMRVLLIAEAATRTPVCWCAEPVGNTGRLEAQLKFWKALGLAPERMVLCGHHVDFEDDEILSLLEGKVRFLLDVAYHEKSLEPLLDRRMEELFEPINYDGSLHDYTLSDSIRIAGSGGRAAEAKALLFRSTSREEDAILALNKELSDFRNLWANADSPEAKALLRDRTTFGFFAESGGELVLKQNIYRGWCRYLGIFGFFGSPNFTPGQAIGLFTKALALRLDFERFCRERLQTVPVRSEASLMGLIFTAFITLTIVAKQAAMQKRQSR